MNTFKEQLKKLLLEVRHGAYITPKIEQICSLIEKEIIGEDEEISDESYGDMIVGENNLRAQQRQTLQGGENK